MDTTALRAKLDTVTTQLKRLGNAEVAETVLTTFAIEFLRVRKVGGFRPIETITISLLMVVVRVIIAEAGKRGEQNGHGKVVVSRGPPPVEPMGYQGDLFGRRRWKRSRRTERYPY